MKKWMSIFLAAVLLFGCFPPEVLAVETDISGMTVKLSNAADGVSVQWTILENASWYQISRCLPGGNWEVICQETTESSFVDTSAENAVTYRYAVRAFVNGELSDDSADAEIMRLEQPKITVANYAAGIQCDWNAVEGAESYNVYRRVPNGKWEYLANTAELTYTDKTAAAGTTYQYGVRAKNGSFLSSIHDRQSIRRLGKPAVTVTNVYDGVSVKWNEIDGAETYRVYRKLPGGSWERLKKGLTDLSWTDTTAEYGVTYLYAVRAYNGTGGSAYASSSEILRMSQPAVEVTNLPGGVKISWNETAEAESYNIYRKTSGGDWKKLSTESDTSFMDTTAESGIKYTYTVRAKNGSSLSSNKLRASILRLDSPTVAVKNAAKGVSVKWEAVAGAESYKVSRKLPDGSWKTLATGIEELNYIDSTAKSGVTYHYTVRAYGGGVYSGYYTSEAIEHLSRPVLKTKTVSTTSVKLTWDAVEGANRYILSVKNEADEWEKLYTGSDTQFTAEDLTFGKTYTFSVSALSSDARSARSATKTGKATYPAPSYSVELKPGKGIKISWKAVDGAGSYRVYRRTEEGDWKTLKTTTSTSYVDTSGRSGTTYEYAVRAYELEGAEGVSGIRATGKTIVYSRVDPDKPMVALTFDDGPSKYTAEILDQLEKYDAHATFFVVGERVSSYSGTIKRAYELGCEIGNHSWSHPDLSSISVSAMKDEISKTDAAIKKVIGVKPALLRPPYGAVDADVKQYAGKPLIHWSVDTRDWDTQSSSSTISSVLNNVRDGSIVLMHDIYSATRTAAVSLIPTLIDKGYQLVTVSELAAYRGVTLKNGTVYYSIAP